MTVQIPAGAPRDVGALVIGERCEGNGQAVGQRHQHVQAAEAVTGGDTQTGGVTALMLRVVDVELELRDAETSRRGNCRKATLTKANLIRATLTRAELGEATLTKADLREATLTEADLEASDLSTARFLVPAQIIPALTTGLTRPPPDFYVSTGVSTVA